MYLLVARPAGTEEPEMSHEIKSHRYTSHRVGGFNQIRFHVTCTCGAKTSGILDSPEAVQAVHVASVERARKSAQSMMAQNSAARREFSF